MPPALLLALPLEPKDLTLPNLRRALALLKFGLGEVALKRTGSVSFVAIERGTSPSVVEKMHGANVRPAGKGVALAYLLFCLPAAEYESVVFLDFLDVT